MTVTAIGLAAGLPAAWGVARVLRGRLYNVSPPDAGIFAVVIVLLLVVAFFAKVSRGVAVALVLLVLTLAQTATGLFGQQMPYLGLWHGLGAFLMFGAAMAAAMLAKKEPAAPSA